MIRTIAHLGVSRKLVRHGYDYLYLKGICQMLLGGAQPCCERIPSPTITIPYSLPSKVTLRLNAAVTMHLSQYPRFTSFGETSPVAAQLGMCVGQVEAR